MRLVSRPGRPRGLRRLLFKGPLLLYRVGLGVMFGRRLVRLEHVGRRSGRAHQVVLEVVDRAQSSGELTVAAGFGLRSDWYRNVLVHPDVQVTMGWRRQAMVAHVLPAGEGAECMVAYARRHRGMGRRVARLMGYDVDGSDSDFAELGRRLPFVRLVPARPSSN